MPLYRVVTTAAKWHRKSLGECVLVLGHSLSPKGVAAMNHMLSADYRISIMENEIAQTMCCWWRTMSMGPDRPCQKRARRSLACSFMFVLLVPPKKEGRVLSAS